jgi:hypothetical protein
MLEDTTTEIQSVTEHFTREHRRQRAKKHDLLTLLGLVLALSVSLLLAGLWVLST